MSARIQIWGLEIAQWLSALAARSRVRQLTTRPVTRALGAPTQLVSGGTCIHPSTPPHTYT